MKRHHIPVIVVAIIIVIGLAIVYSTEKAHAAFKLSVPLPYGAEAKNANGQSILLQDNQNSQWTPKLRMSSASTTRGR